MAKHTTGVTCKVKLTNLSFPQQISSKFESCQHLPFRKEGSTFGAVIGQLLCQSDLEVSLGSLHVL